MIWSITSSCYHSFESSSKEKLNTGQNQVLKKTKGAQVKNIRILHVARYPFTLSLWDRDVVTTVTQVGAYREAS